MTTTGSNNHALLHKLEIAITSVWSTIDDRCLPRAEILKYYRPEALLCMWRKLRMKGRRVWTLMKESSDPQYRCVTSLTLWKSKERPTSGKPEINSSIDRTKPEVFLTTPSLLLLLPLSCTWPKRRTPILTTCFLEELLLTKNVLHITNCSKHIHTRRLFYGMRAE